MEQKKASPPKYVWFQPLTEGRKCSLKKASSHLPRQFFSSFFQTHWLHLAALSCGSFPLQLLFVSLYDHLWVLCFRLSPVISQLSLQINPSFIHSLNNDILCTYDVHHLRPSPRYHPANNIYSQCLFSLSGAGDCSQPASYITHSELSATTMLLKVGSMTISLPQIRKHSPEKLKDLLGVTELEDGRAEKQIQAT